MSRFYDSENQNLSNVPNQPRTAPRPQVRKGNGGVSNEYYLNDYRNRMPFHYIESGGDGYYYWMYGATMVIDFIFEDLSLSVTDSRPPYLVNFTVNGQDIVDENGAVNLTLGTIAERNVDDYYTKQQSDEQVSVLWNSLNARSAALTNKIVELERRESSRDMNANNLYQSDGDLLATYGGDAFTHIPIDEVGY